MEKLNIVFATDENYVIPTIITMKSVVEHTSDIELSFYISCDNLDNWKDSSKKAFNIIQKDNVTIKLVDASGVNTFCEKYNLPKYKGSYSIYTKLFMPDIVDDLNSNVLFLEGDMIIRNSLKELAHTHNGKGVYACIDMSNCKKMREMFKLGKDEIFGIFSVFLVEPKKWKENKIIEKVVSWVNKYDGEYLNSVGSVVPADQFIISASLKGEWDILPAKYQVFPGNYLIKYERFLRLFNLDKDEYYSQSEYESAKKNPYVIHYMHFIVPKPWLHDKFNPLENMWTDYYNQLGLMKEMFPLKEYNQDINAKLRRILFKYFNRLYVEIGRRHIDKEMDRRRKVVESYEKKN